YKSLAARLPLFLLDNGSVAFSDSSGYLAVWDAHHAHFAGLWAAGSEATMTLTVIAVLAAVLMLCVRLLRGRPFSRAMTRWVDGAGGARAGGDVHSARHVLARSRCAVVRVKASRGRIERRGDAMRRRGSCGDHHRHCSHPVV